MQDKNQNLLYFAYGEHMNEEEMKKLCPQARKVGMSALEGYTLCFFGRDGMGRAGLEAAPGRHVPGCVWVLPEAQAEQLDQEADCPFFARREIRTFSIGGMALPALVYITVPGQQRGRPGFVAYDIMREAYAEAGLDVAILQEAAARSAP